MTRRNTRRRPSPNSRGRSRSGSRSRSRRGSRRRPRRRFNPAVFIIALILILPPFGWLGGKLVSWWQNYILRKCKASWIASPDQVSIVSSICPCVALPNLPMPPALDYKVNGNQKHQLMTVGLMSYEPNYEGVDWFLNNVWLDVKNKIPDLMYKICGRGTPERLCRKWSQMPGVEVLGFVEDIDRVYEESMAVITPILSGAGTCIKVPEAALRGRKVFATPFAVRGISGKDIHDMGISVVGEAQELKSAIIAWMAKSGKARDDENSVIEGKTKSLYSADKLYRIVKATICNSNK